MRIVGDGRAGGALARALATVGWQVSGPWGRAEDPTDAAAGVDLVVVATPDGTIAEVAARIRPDPGVLIVHLAGASGPTRLGDHPRRGVLHPLVSLPDPSTGARRLGHGAWFAVDADTDADRVWLEQLVAGLGGHAVHVAEEHRAAYHAAAVVASNHLVALIGQVERIAAGTGVPLEAFLGLAAHTLAGLEGRSPAEMLTGPVARGDWDTVRGHLAVLDAGERPAYAALAEAAAGLAGRADEVPGWLHRARCPHVDDADGPVTR